MGRPLTPLSDPMTGFFGIRKDVVCCCIVCSVFPLFVGTCVFLQYFQLRLVCNPPFLLSLTLRFDRVCLHQQFERGTNVSSLGFKICLELYVKCAVRRHAEVPFSFGVRVHGESKLTGKVIVKYLQQLKELYWYRFKPLVIVLVLVLLLAVAFVLWKVFGAK